MKKYHESPSKYNNQVLEKRVFKGPVKQRAQTAKKARMVDRVYDVN